MTTLLPNAPLARPAWTARLWHHAAARWLRERRTAAPWQPVDDGGWRTAAGCLEVHLRRDPDIGWRVEVRDPAEDRALGRPTFARRLDDAMRVARYLSSRYASYSVRAASTSR